ncbi:MAG: hypothetical protein RL140_437 [Actinomycetota bacterium]|jgi:hypothetical protein
MRKVIAMALLWLLTISLASPLQAFASPNSCTITVSASDQKINGTNHQDVICIIGNRNIVNALGGDDVVVDEGDDNTINLGDGNDTIDASSGLDAVISGGSGSDSITGSPGPDEIGGGQGDDSIVAGAGDDEVYGGSGNDDIAGDVGEDAIFGEAGGDTLHGGDQDDTLQGGTGQDHLYGDAGTDTCSIDADDFTNGSSCESTVTLDLRTPHTLSVHFVDSLGNPVSGAYLQLDGQEPGSLSGHTDSSGEFTFTAVAGDYTLLSSFRAPVPDGLTLGISLSFAVALYSDKQLNVVVPDPIRMKVHVQDSAGNPLVGASVYQQDWASFVGTAAGFPSFVDQVRGGDELNISQMWQKFYSQVNTDSNGDAYVYGYMYGFEVFTAYSYNGVTVRPSKTVDSSNVIATVALPAVHSLSVHFVDTSGVAISDVGLSLNDGSPGSLGGHTDSNGDFTFTAVEGDYTLLSSFRAPTSDGSTLGISLQFAFALNSDKQLNVVVPDPVRMKVHVQDGSGNSLVGATVDQQEWATFIGTSAGFPTFFDQAHNGDEFQITQMWQRYYDRVTTDNNGDAYVYGYMYGFEVTARYTANGVQYVKPLQMADYPGAVTELHISNVRSGGVTLDFQQPSYTGGVAITKYLIELSTDGEHWFPVSDGDATSTSRTANKLLGATHYSVRISAINARGRGPYLTSDFTTASPQISAPPTDLDFSLITAKTAHLDFLSPIDEGGSPVTELKVEVSRDGLRWVQLNRSNSKSTSYNVSGLAPKTTYQVRIQAKNSIGFSEYLTNSFTTLSTTPSAPQNVTVTEVGYVKASLVWQNPSTNGGFSISDYQIQYSTGGSVWKTISHSKLTSRKFTVEGLKPGVSYSFRLAAVNSKGIGDYSESLNLTTLARVQGAPKSLAVSNSSNSIQIKWVDAKLSEATPTLDYIIEYSTDGATWQTVSKPVSASTKLTISGLLSKTFYFFKITAVNSVGNSAASKVLKVRTK